jgi:hypothetical protein
MVSFYAWPVLAVGLVAVMRGTRWRWLCGITAGLVVTVCSDFHLNAWAWWGIVTGGIVVVLLAGIPSRLRRPVPINTNVAEVAPIRDHAPALVGARP